MKKSKLLLGDEALALAACDAGVKAFYGYPGTPSTEIFEAGEIYVKKLNDGRIAEWAANEKVAYEFALGTSYAGFRTVVTMKHVGLNVAFDAFVNSAITGVQGGLVVAVADDPSMHSSQNEQDTRILADFAQIPLLEPSTPQQVYDYTLQAFELSEKLKLPVVLRLVTRLSHSRGEVFDRDEKLKPTGIGIPSEKDKKSWVLVPGIARKRYRQLREKMPELVEAVRLFNSLSIDKGNKEGIVISGMGAAYFGQYVKDNHIDISKYNILRIGAYPLDKEMIKSFSSACQKIRVFEENYPYLEDMIIPYCENKCEVHGRRDNTLPIDGELNIAKIRKALGHKKPKGKVDQKLLYDILKIIEIRPPRLCDHCGHSDAFIAIKESLKNIGVDDPRIFGDIGCYTLGVQEPFDAIHTCVEMGASLSMAFGAAMAGMSPSVGVIGDSTFFHSGMPTLLSAAKHKLNLNLVIMDNAIVGMTGQQIPVAADIAPAIARATGFGEEQIHILTPVESEKDKNIRILQKVFQTQEPSLIIFKRKCIQALKRNLYAAEVSNVENE